MRIRSAVLTSSSRSSQYTQIFTSLHSLLRRHQSNAYLSHAQRNNNALHCNYRSYHIGQEGTIRDTPSGYINDPSVVRPFIDYKKNKNKTADEVVEDIMHSEELQREDLRYEGYTTLEVQRAKDVAVTMSSTTEQLVAARKSLEPILDYFVDSASGDSGLIKRRDCHHVRFILSLLCRRTHDIATAQKYLDEILDDEPMNTDALEGRLEIIVGTEGRIEKELKPLLDRMQARDPNYIVPAYLFLADFLVTSAGEYYAANGEGGTSVFFLKAIAPIARSIGPEHTSMFIQATFNALDELHQTVQQYKQNAIQERRSKGQSSELPAHLTATVNDAIGLNVAFLKTVLSRNLAQFVSDSLFFEYHVLRKLYVALHGADRKRESYSIAEKLIQLFRANRDVLTNEANEEDSYRVTLFQYIHDRSHDAPVVGEPLCIEAIEEYPNSSIPWKLLSVILHQQGNVKDALIAAHKALSLTPNDVSVLLLLANLHKAANQAALSSEYMERYKMIVVLQEQGLDEADVDAMMHAPLESLDPSIVQQRHEDRNARDEAELTDHFARYKAAHTYTKETIVAAASPIRAEEVFGDPELNVDRPSSPLEREDATKQKVKKLETREGLDQAIRLTKE